MKGQSKIEVDKELTLKELELKAHQNQTSASLAPPRNKDAKPPKLPSFIDEKDGLDSYLLRFEHEETSDQFVIRLKNYLAKWLELCGSSPENFDALVDLIVKEQFINACSEDLAMYLLERGPKDLVELTTGAQKYLIAHKHQQE